MIDNSAIAKIKSNIAHREATLSDNKGAIFSILTESVYTYPRVAGIREVISNGIDSTNRAKTNKPVQIKPPSALDTSFSVRDFGLGLLDSEVYDLYTSLGSSSKKDIEDEIGFFGIGALSPLAYVESFNATSYMDGVARLYSIFMGENGVPRVAPIGETKTDQPNGLLVSYTVKREDINQFITEIANVLKYIEPAKYSYSYKVPYYKDTKNTDKNLTLKFNDNIFITAKQYYGSNENNILVMGGVAYEFDPTYLKNNLFNRYTLLIEAPIGAVSVQASREKLKLNKKTLTYIQDVVQFIQDNIKSEVQKQVDNATDYWTALRIVERMTIVKLTNMEWRGIKLDTQNISEFLKDAEVYFDIRVKYRKQMVIYGSDAQNRVYHQINHTFNIILDDTKKGGLGRIKDNIHGATLVFIQKSPEETEQFIKKYGNPFSDRASKLPEPPKGARAAQRSKKKVYELLKGKISGGFTFNRCTAEFTGDFDKFDGYYLIVKNRSVIYNDLRVSMNGVFNVKDLIDKPIIMIDWETKELPKLAKPFIDYFVSNYKSFIEDYYKIQYINNVVTSTKLGFLYKNIPHFKQSLDGLKNNKMSITEDQYRRTYINNVIDFARSLGLDIPDLNIYEKYEKKVNKIVETTYPLMDALNYSAYTSPLSKHLKEYILSNDQEVFKDCFQ